MSATRHLVPVRDAVRGIRILLNEDETRQQAVGSTRTSNEDIILFIKFVLWKLYNENSSLFKGSEDREVFRGTGAEGREASVNIPVLIANIALPDNPDPEVKFSNPPKMEEYMPINPQGIIAVVLDVHSVLQVRDHIAVRPEQGVVSAELGKVGGARGT